MPKQLSDTDRAKLLGMTLDEFYAHASTLDADDYLRDHLNTEVAESVGAKMYSGREELEEHMASTRGLPGSTDLYDAANIDIHWNKYPETAEEKAVYYGYHIHSKDNVYGLHTHVPGGSLGGGHKHDPQNPLGHHTHAVDIQALEGTGLEGGLTGRGPINIDGPHEHQMLAPDGGHHHSPSTFA